MSGFGNTASDFLSKSDRRMLFGISFFLGHGVTTLAMTVEAAAAAIGYLAGRLLPGHLVFQLGELPQWTVLFVPGIKYRPGLIGYNDPVCLLAERL